MGREFMLADASEVRTHSSWMKAFSCTNKAAQKQTKEETHTLGWAQWNQSRFEFKFDDTRLSS